MNKDESIPVWFFIGLLLTIYGILLTVAGLYQILHPPGKVLEQYHPTLWAGIALFLWGIAYVILFLPEGR